MHCIITNDQKVIKCAKEKGEKVIEIEKSVIVDNEEKFKYVNVTPKIVETFLKKFPRIDMEDKGVNYLKYILENQLGLWNDLESLYPTIGNEFDTNCESIGRGIMRVYASCITNLPKCYENFFDNYECSVHWDYKHSFDFVKACQKYIYENYESLCEKTFSSNEIDEFLNEFGCINKKSLGYKCVKYILENKIELTFETKDTVFKELAGKFDKHPSDIARSITLVFKSVTDSTIITEKFRTFYNKLRSQGSLFIGERSIELIQIFKKYLEQN